MTEMYMLNLGSGKLLRDEDATGEALREWIMSMDGGRHSTIYIAHPIGGLRILGGGGNSGRVVMIFDTIDSQGVRIVSTITNPDDQGNERLITIMNDDEVLLSLMFQQTLPKEKACEIGAHLLKHGRFPKDITWNGSDLSPYQ